jgi:GT2 family glycosyltransferase/glycosyltransferase involved in cell wall biosynthesis
MNINFKTPGAGYHALAVGLADRLAVMEARVHDLERDKSGLQRKLIAATTRSATGTAAFDIPRTKHEWVMAEDASRAPEDLWLYDIRPDDPVPHAARQGDAFMRRFGLDGDAPDFATAAAALNEIEAPQAGPVDVSIIIPVHGQLNYTLNMLDSLLRHPSRHALEIIIVDDASPDETGLFLPRIRLLRYHRQAANGGFIASCNACAALARGRFVVMLNNDTRVVAGWLDRLIGSFELFPKAGLVGSKMFYPDGRLQEAGGIIWRDGTAWNYGHGDDPNRPQYCYARRADYISGCSIALPRTLWNQLGGFDAHFHPAYCEDVDLAFRVREAGFEVWFQPQSRIIHYEGKTSGTDTASGVKAYQRINTKKIYLRWHEQLSRHRPNGHAPYFERERDVCKRMLVVDATAPTPDQDAGSVQTFMALQVCMALGYKTHFVPQDNWLFQPRYTNALQEMGVDCAYAPFELGFESYMQRFGALFDAVLVYRPGVLEHCLPHIRNHAPQAALLFHVADLHYLRMERMAALTGDADTKAAAARMKQRELSLIGQADCTITHSSHEREVLAAAVPGCPVALWPLMFEHFGTSTPFADRRDICFLGGYRHLPNIDAVQYFVAEIFPRLRVVLPGVRFIIAGSHMPREIVALAAPDIIVAGSVEDLRTVFDACRVFVCPLRAGAGVKGKVASAMSYGIPVVSTPVGVEGAGLVHETHVLVADGPEQFSSEITRLYHDEALWNALSRNGQDMVCEHLSLAMGRRVLARGIETAFAQKFGV